MKTKSKMIRELQRDIQTLEKRRLTKRPKCGCCGSTGIIERYDQLGNVESESQCQACDLDWINADIDVRQIQLRNAIAFIQKAHREALESVPTKPKRRKRS